MALYLSENQELKGKKFKLSKETADNLKDTLTFLQGLESKDKFRSKREHGRKEIENVIAANDGDGIGYSELKKLDFEKRHLVNNPNKKTIKTMVIHDTGLGREATSILNRERTKVAPVLKQKKAETRNKNAAKVVKKPMKPIALDNGDSIKMTEGKKTIYINESMLPFLLEYHAQQVIPFETIKDKNGNTLFYGNDGGKKMMYQHFIDYLESFGTYGTLPASNSNIEELIQENMDSAVDMLVNKQLDYCDETFYGDMGWAVYNLIDENENIKLSLTKVLSDIYADDIFYDDECDAYCCEDESSGEIEIILRLSSYSDFMDDIDYNYDVIDIMRSRIGKQADNEFFNNRIDTNGIFDGLETNDRGLIYIERAITIPYAFDKNLDNDYYDNQTFYDFLKNNFNNGVGVYWSWAKGESNPYCEERYYSESGGKSGTNTTLILRGYIDPNGVDWKQTLFKSAYDLNYEKEIEVNDKALIELDSIEVTEDYYSKNILQSPIIVKA